MCMKISDKPEIHSQAEPNPDNTSASQSDSSFDFMYLIMQSSFQSETDSGDAELPTPPQDAKKDDETQLTSDTSVPTDINPLLAQLNMINFINNDQIQNVDSEITLDTSDINLESKMVSDLMQPSNPVQKIKDQTEIAKKMVDQPVIDQKSADQKVTNQKNTDQNTDQKSADQKIIVKPLVDMKPENKQINNLSKNNLFENNLSNENINENIIEAKQLSSLNTIDPITDEQLIIDQKILDKHLVSQKRDDKQIIDNQKITPKQEESDSHESLFMGAKTIISPPETPQLIQQPTQREQSEIAFNNLLNKVANEPVALQPEQANQYTQAFTQLGNFINSHTSNIYANNAQQLPPDANLQLSNYTDSLKKSQPDYGLNIELFHPSVDEFNKQIVDARIKIYPPELGPMLAKLKIDKNNAELIITTENAKVKEIVESNLAQLREKFQQSDINLTSIQVQTHSQTSQFDTKGQNNNGHGNNEPTSPEMRGNHPDKEAVTSKESPSLRNDAIVDTYA